MQCSLLAAILAGYLIGSIPSGVIFSKLFGTGDIRKQGSGSIGATNALRTQGKGVAALTLFADTIKGVIGYFAALAFIPLQTDHLAAHTFQAMGVIFPVVGHTYPIWLKFHGGKGIATALGVIIASCPSIAVACCAVWGCVFLIFRISSVASIISALAAPIIYKTGLFETSGQLLDSYLFLAVLILYRHKDNIIRLLKGEEKKISIKKK